MRRIAAWTVSRDGAVRRGIMTRYPFVVSGFGVCAKKDAAIA